MNDDRPYDPKNVFEFLKDIRYAVQSCRKSIGLEKGAWNEIRGVFESSLLAGVPAIEGLLVNDDDVGQSRYFLWKYSHAARILSAANQVPEWVRLIGGTLRSEVACKRLATLLDRALTDLLLLCAKIDRPGASDSGDDEHSESKMLVRLLKNSGRDLSFAHTEKFRKIVHDHLDDCVYLFWWDMRSQRTQWLVVLRIETSFSRFFETAADCLAGELTNLHFLSGVEQGDRLESIRVAQGATDPAQEAQLLARLQPIVSDPGAFCFLSVLAHPDVVSDRTELRMGIVGALVTLLRPSTNESIEPEFSTSRGDDDSLEISIPRETVRVFAATAFAVPTHDEDVSGPIHGIERFDESVSFHLLDRGLLPMDQDELDRCSRFVAQEPTTLPWIIYAIESGDELSPIIDTLRKSIFFWSQAERILQDMRGLSVTPSKVAESFVYYCIVAEVLLGAKNDLVQVIASRAAAILATDPTERLRVFDRVKDLYNLRSRYLHEGKVLIRSSDLINIREVVRGCLLYALRWAACQSSVRLVLLSKAA